MKSSVDPLAGGPAGSPLGGDTTPDLRAAEERDTSAPRAIQRAAAASLASQSLSRLAKATAPLVDLLEVRCGGSPLCELPSHRPYPPAAGHPHHSLPAELPPLNAQVRLSLQASRQVELGRRLAAKLEDVHCSERQAIHHALVRFSSEQVAADEFARSCDYLGDLASIHGYLQAEVGLAVVFLPQNLPLYSLVLFAVVPALQAQRVVLHFPSDLAPPERARRRAALPALPIYCLVLGELRKLMRQVVRDMLDPPGSPEGPQTPRGSRLKNLWRGAWVNTHPQRPDVRVQLNAFGIITHDHEVMARRHDAQMSDLLGGLSDEGAQTLRAASAAHDQACRRPHDGGLALEANQAARQLSAEVLARGADVVIFTGSSKSARAVRRAVGEHGLLLVNGSGYNPVTIGPQSDAELDVAVAKTVHARLFHNGQDCAAPDAILVERSMLRRFLSKLQAQISEVMGERRATMLPLLSEDKFNAACAFIKDSLAKKYGREVISGSGNNALTQSLEPTVVLQTINSVVQNYGNFTRLMGSKLAYQEFYAPVFYVLSYVEGTSDMAFYFNAGKYHENEMYVSTFGSCPWLQQNLPRSEILTAETVFDIDKGTIGYGAMGSDSTYAVHRGTLKIGPIQVPREISLFYRRQIRSSPELRRSALALQVTGGELAETREDFCKYVRERLREVLADYNARLSPAMQPRVEAAFFYGPFVDDDFAFSAQASLDAGPGGGDLSLGHSERVNLLLVFDRKLESVAAQEELEELPAALSRKANWTFNERSSIVVATSATVYDALRHAHHQGAANTHRMLTSALPREQIRYLHIIEALAAKRRLWCFADKSIEEGETYRRWCEKSRRVYRCWQEAIHNKLTSERFFARSSAVTRRYAHPPDIIVSDAIHMRAAR